MTDPGAPPLNPTLQKLEAALRGIEERLPHTEDCIQLSQARFTGGGHEFTVSCNCGHAARVRAEQARAVERLVEGAMASAVLDRAPLTPADKARAWETAFLWECHGKGAAALRAGEEPRT